MEALSVKAQLWEYGASIQMIREQLHKSSSSALLLLNSHLTSHDLTSVLYIGITCIMGIVHYSTRRASYYTFIACINELINLSGLKGIENRKSFLFVLSNNVKKVYPTEAMEGSLMCTGVEFDS